MSHISAHPGGGLDIAVVGSGIGGLSAAWLLSQGHRVTLYEAEPRLGGHTNTVEVPDGRDPAKSFAVDTGFIVYNMRSYPNLVALFDHLGVETTATDMSFAVSLNGGGLEYKGGDSLLDLFAQPTNALKPRFWRMIVDLLRFYREAPKLLESDPQGTLSLGDYLKRENYSAAFVEDHLLPMGAAIWSCPMEEMARHPAVAFIRFCDNHGLLQVNNRPVWRTVVGGARNYVERLTGDLAAVRVGAAIQAIRRDDEGVTLTDAKGHQARHDHVVIAAHGDQALAMLADPSDAETRLLGHFAYQPNVAYLHRDVSLMPKRRRAWASWVYLGEVSGNASGLNKRDLAVSYWMNSLQPLPDPTPLMVTLNPPSPPAADKTLQTFNYAHPLLDGPAVAAQSELWRLQGARRTWFCGAWFGAGFHEDGLQSGLAVAEALGGRPRPWTVDNPSGRIHLAPHGTMSATPLAAETTP
ncbi:NAD(P)/FAD-dependent oxidoreductase [Roseospirillum parvum]|uniref:Predicted NAD/FAD-binding protein n=1 Tax=Roseospirillum parvum TaxID=83401 RepID=A0A1G7XYT9_9PROT|nr:FAD-dependent oxidoreductase [Roseospirillum parvum]SDG89263.1 Predicted NAD/FAD-binding protein [Roseospirillum parvum]